MKSHESKSGFTLVELMVVALAFSILALATGSMLVFGWQGWKRMNDSVDMQRDASLAMRVMAREVRKSTIANITVGSGQLGCVNPDGEAIGFAVSGGNLDMSVDGTFFMHLIRRQSVSLTSEITNGVAVVLTLGLDTGNDSGDIESIIYVRN